MDEYKEKLTAYYNKFSEEKRLGRRHGQVEFRVTLHYLARYLRDGMRILDVGAGTGRYALWLKEQGYDVTAVELTRPNIAMMKKKDAGLKVIEADARDLRMLKDESFDLVLLLGPLYHLHQKEDKLLALREAKRVTKKGGYILAAYIMNEYALTWFAFKENNYQQIKDKLDGNFHILPEGNELYSYVRLEEIAELNTLAGLKREKIFAPDGAADYMRPALNAMCEETFEAFVAYQTAMAERPELLGASSHIVDILRKD